MTITPCYFEPNQWPEPQKGQNQQKSFGNSIEDLPLLLSVTDVQTALGIGRNSTYALLRSGQLKSIRVGRLIKIPRTALEEYLSSY